MKFESLINVVSDTPHRLPVKDSGVGEGSLIALNDPR
jgi:hypothetical protein